MTSLNRGPLVIKTLDAMKEYGEITGVELAEHLGIDIRVAHGTLKRLSTRTRAGLKRMYIMRWDSDHQGAKRYPRPVYALGDQLDARKPKADQLARKREYYHRVKGKTLMNSVFNLGKQWRAGT